MALTRLTLLGKPINARGEIVKSPPKSPRWFSDTLQRTMSTPIPPLDYFDGGEGWQRRFLEGKQTFAPIDFAPLLHLRMPNMNNSLDVSRAQDENRTVNRPLQDRLADLRMAKPEMSDLDLFYNLRVFEATDRLNRLLEMRQDVASNLRANEKYDVMTTFGRLWDTPDDKLDRIVHGKYAYYRGQRPTTEGIAFARAELEAAIKQRDEMRAAHVAASKNVAAESQRARQEVQAMEQEDRLARAVRQRALNDARRRLVVSPEWLKEQAAKKEADKQEAERVAARQAAEKAATEEAKKRYEESFRAFTLTHNPQAQLEALDDIESMLSTLRTMVSTARAMREHLDQTKRLLVMAQSMYDADVFVLVQLLQQYQELQYLLMEQAQAHHRAVEGAIAASQVSSDMELGGATPGGTPSGTPSTTPAQAVAQVGALDPALAFAQRFNAASAGTGLQAIAPAPLFVGGNGPQAPGVVFNVSMRPPGSKRVQGKPAGMHGAGRK